MSNTSVLSHQTQHSLLGSLSVLNPESKRGKKNIVADLLLTALIDAFSILVIFLLMSFSSTGEILFLGKMELPTAAQATALDRHPVVRLEDQKIYIEDKEVTVDSLTAELLELKKKFLETRPGEEPPGIITIQADRRTKFESLSVIVQAAAQAGYSDLKFATVMK